MNKKLTPTKDVDLGDAEFNLKPDPKKMPKSTGAGELRALNALLTEMGKPDINPQTPNKIIAVPAKAVPGIPGNSPGPAPVAMPPQKRVAAPMLNPSRMAHPRVSPPARVIAPEPAPAMTKLPPQLSLFFTGRMKAGKDYCAKAAGAEIFSLAEPLYALLKFYFGTDNKDAHGARRFLQHVGQWGRNDISEQYPISAERAAFCTAIRQGAGQVMPASLCVDWKSFGRDKDIWVKACLKRVEAWRKENGEGRRVAITNVRFENEFKAFKAAGWSHWHVMCSQETRDVRLLSAGLDPKAPEQSDVSESVAAAFDADMGRRVKQPGGMLKCVWSDDHVAPPSPRIFRLPAWGSALSDSLAKEGK